MPSHRDPGGPIVFWQGLAEYITDTYDFDAASQT
jgi:hypothetical protein